MTRNVPCPALDIVQDRLKWLHDTWHRPWREIAALDEYKGIPAGSLCSIAKGRDPTNPEYRRILGLPLMIEIGGKKYELTEVE